MTTARKPKAKAGPRLNLRVVGVILVVAMVTVPVAVLAGRSIFVTRSEFETTIRDAGFYPLTPPSKLVMPGSIYQVSQDGRFYTTICRANEADVVPYAQESETQSVVASSLQNGAFDLNAEAAGEINARLNGSLIRAVQFSLRDVAVIEIPLDRNEEIFVKLTSQKPCHDAVQRLLERGDLVCQGQSVLRATVEYRLVASGSAEAIAEMLGSAIKSALEGALKTSIAYEDGRLVSGINLHYGVKVNPICVTLPSEDVPRHLPPVRSGQIAMLAP